MKTLYQCEVCLDKYDTAEQALACENKPKPYAPPIGLIFGNACGPGLHSKNMTFCVAKVTPERGRHWAHVSLWACRDNGAGDTEPGGKELCGGSTDSFSGTPWRVDPPCPSHPTFTRMVKKLRAAGITDITCWDGEQPVPLATFVRSRRTA